MSSRKTQPTPGFGDGIYSAKDAAEILHLSYHSVQRLMNGYWKDFSTGTPRNKTINFLSLIEFYFYYYLRKKGISGQQIRKLHARLQKDFITQYPFASLKFKMQGKEIWIDYFGLLMKADGRMQPSFKEIVEPFLEQIEYGEDFLARRFFPYKESKDIVVDPKKQFGKPIIDGKGVRTEVIYRFYLGGETPEAICDLYQLNDQQVKDAINYHLKAA